MRGINISITDDLAFVYTPYHPAFIKLIKKIGSSKWDGVNQCWVLPAVEVDQVRNYMMEVYGETDLTDHSTDVDVIITFKSEKTALCQPVYAFGRAIVRATGRDSGARTCEGVTFLDGYIKSGGSRANWQTIVTAGTRLLVRGVPRNKVAEWDGDIEILEHEVNREELKGEREKLVARISEIDKILAELDKESH